MSKQPGMMTHTFNADTQVAKAGRSWSFEVSQGYTVRCYLKKKRKKEKEKKSDCFKAVKAIPTTSHVFIFISY